MTGSEIARILGSRGGRARAERLSGADKRRIASQGGKARRDSLAATRRILENLRYVRSVEELRGAARAVLSEPTFAGRLPDLSSSRS